MLTVYRGGLSDQCDLQQPIMLTVREEHGRPLSGMDVGWDLSGTYNGRRIIG